jgi:hypothetical protein
MARHSKRYRSGAQPIDREKRYALGEAIELAIGGQRCKFDETVEMSIRLNVDPRQADQNVRGTVVLPNGIGKSQRVLVFAKGQGSGGGRRRLHRRRRHRQEDSGGKLARLRQGGRHAGHDGPSGPHR